MAKRRAKGEGSLFFEKSKKRWTARITLPDGKTKKKRFISQNDAQNWLFEQRRLLRKGVALDSPNVSVGDYLTRYMEDVASHTLKPGTLRSYNHYVNAHIIPAIGHIKLTLLRPEHLQNLYARKLDEGLSKRTVQYMHSIIRVALNQAVAWDLIIRNPTARVKPPKPARKQHETLTVAQAKKLLESVDNPRWKTIYTIAVLMGLRKSEILGLRWDDIDFNSGRISINNIVYEVDGTIYQGTPKTESSRRTVLMPTAVANALRDYKETTDGEGLVFTTATGRPVSQRNLSRHFYKALDKAELPRIRFHDLRHTAATLLLKENVHPKVVQDLLGHSTITLTLDTYSHVIPDIQKEAADQMDSLFEGTL